MLNRKLYAQAYDYITAVLLGVLAVGLLVKSEAVSQGIKTGLETCAGVLIPALFPFMALACYFSITSGAEILSKPISFITTKVFKLPKELGATVLLSLIGGYPVGAKCISTLLAQKKINAKTAGRMLCFCVNSGPSFVITAVGSGMLVDRTAGLVLFATQTAATLLIGAAISFRSKPVRIGGAREQIRGAQALVSAVSAASSSMLAMCAFTTLFSGLLSLISAVGFTNLAASLLHVDNDIINAVTGGIFEVTSGCIGISQLGISFKFALMSAAVSFGGLSVWCQIMSCFKENPVSFKPFIASRAAHMALSTVMAVPLYKYFCDGRSASLTNQKPVMVNSGSTMLVSACLICMCIILTMMVRFSQRDARAVRNK